MPSSNPAGPEKPTRYPQCADCFYWHHEKAVDNLQAPADAPQRMAACRRYPPQLATVHQPACDMRGRPLVDNHGLPKTIANTLPMMPMTPDSAYCGEWRAL